MNLLRQPARLAYGVPRSQTGTFKDKEDYFLRKTRIDGQKNVKLIMDCMAYAYIYMYVTASSQGRRGRYMPVAAREKERKIKGDRKTAPDRQRRPIGRETGATRKSTPPSSASVDVESRRARRRGEGEELKEVMKIRRSRKGAYDMRMRRSTRKTGALILDLVTLTPAGVSLPAYYTRLRTH
ncbi:Uncharacterized protein DBV15_09326 [Temnothorax longispinosus]|uniref:Uncharacterized protein n=1 Tax=Temnothorax longispinosus TaxID=300112 RepID=A0A4S2KKB4_9HYME|nr:Uncharacterized protein DBV15_09326 [Temnothorax longispinosus]